MTDKKSNKTPSKIDIRHAKPGEAAHLTRIAFAAKRFWRYPEAYIALWQNDLTISPEFIEQNDVFAAIKMDTIVGFYALSNSEGVRELEHFWIDPKYIGKGIGRELFRHVRNGLKTANVEKVRIVADHNALGFYKKMGAKQIGDVASTPPGRFLPVMEYQIY